MLDKISALFLVWLPLYLLCLAGNICDLHRHTKKDARKAKLKYFSNPQIIGINELP